MFIKNLLEYFENTAAANADKTAVIDGERTISFGALSEKACELAYNISLKVNAAVKLPVATYFEKSIECVVGDIAIIYSGNAYMNLDVKTPIQRIGNILELVKPALVITNGAYYEKLKEVYDGIRIINLDDELAMPPVNWKAEMYQALEKTIDTDPLCIINTSGSTGTPKGVVLNHRSFIDFTEWALRTMNFDANEILGCLSPVVFDIYSFELCMLMAKSSTMVLIPESLAAFPAKILQLLQVRKVSFIFWVPTIMVNIANMDLISRIPLSDLKTVWFAGEVFPTKQFNYWHKMLPNARFVNLYGPIEITLDCTYYIIDRELGDDEPIPIGFPCRNTDILILNDKNEPCAQGEEGELCVRGTSLAMGYYNNPEKTSAAFVQNPLNSSYPEIIYRTGDIVSINERGEIMFQGRKDSLIKHSGYRIELGEIEHVIINTLKQVNNGCAVYDHAKKEIVFFYEAAEEKKTGELRKAIGEALPKYMIPNRFIFTSEMPRNPNGKIDRLKLKESVAQTNEYC